MTRCVASQVANEKIRDLTSELERSESARKKSEAEVKTLSGELENSNTKCRNVEAELKVCVSACASNCMSVISVGSVSIASMQMILDSNHSVFVETR